MKETDIIQLLKDHANIDEVAEMHFFEGHRINKKGERQEVTIKIGDMGKSINPNLRYYCVAKSENGKEATGNSGSTIEEVIATVQWNELD